MSKKALLIILDGYGIGDHKKDDVIFNTPTPYMDSIVAEYPHSQLQASGENVGLPDGQMGNSEVGHLNIGAGRVVYQDLVKINRAIADGSFAENQEIKNAFTYAQKNGVPIHFMGLASAGGVHSSLGHLYALCDTAKAYGLDKVFIHAFMDGRDTDPKSGAGFLQEIQDHCKQSTGTIASVVGRYYAMDRDHRWERIKDAYNLLVYGEGKHADNMVKAVEESYAEGVTDEFIKPIVNDRVDGRIGAGHVVIFFNYRNDRAKELTTVLTQHSEDGMNPIPDLQYYCMTPYDDSFKGVHILFTKSDVPDTLGEFLSREGKKQLHIAETEKYAHVTFFFNGGKEEPNPGEDRILVNSPKVATYDLQPEMSAPEVCEKLVGAIGSEKYDVVICNFANPDMVGHTGVEAAAIQAIETVDACVGKAVDAVKKAGGQMLICADHGNAEQMIDYESREPFTAHTTNPVPFILVNADPSYSLREGGRLADIVPTLIDLMEMEQPKEMTGESLLVRG